MTQRTNAKQRALAHPLRARVFTILQQRTASPSMVAREINEHVGVVSYHVRVLVTAGLVDAAGTTPRRGALEHFYRAADAPGQVGTTLMLAPAAAARLMREISDAVERASARPGDVQVVVVGHHGNEAA